MTSARVWRGIGKMSISAGVLLLLFVAYQLWGTGIAEGQAQGRLRREFRAAAPVTAAPAAAPAPPSVVPTGPSTTLPALPAPPSGAALAIIKIPKIGVEAAVVQGVGVEDLKDGPGHYPTSAMPGHAGNSAIAGHRTTYGAPFSRLDELVAGDVILVSTRDAATPWQYQVASSRDVSPDDIAVLDPSPDARLTLTTCTPRYTAAKRLIVVALLVGPADSRPAPAPPPAGPPTAAGDAAAVPPVVVGGLSGRGATTQPAIAWGFACIVVWALAWAIGRRRRRWACYALATPLFLVCLFFFFENFARFVPANI